MPNLTYFRPCNAEETVAAWTHALSARTSPTMISLGRDPVGPVPNTNRQSALKGAYVIQEQQNADLTLVSCGTNLHYAVGAADLLSKDGLKVRIVSCPSFDLFDQQSAEYRASVFPLDGKPIISVEEYVATTWARYTTASIGMTSYGYSASNPSNYERFGLNAAGITKKTKAYLKELEQFEGNARMAGWRQL